MKFDPASRLREYVDSLARRGHCSGAEMIDVMRRTRLLIEKGKTAATYPILAMYCDWTMHGEMDRNEGGHALLREVDQALVNNWASDPSHIIKAISEALSLATLRKELIKIFEANNINTLFFDVLNNWLDFVRALLGDLLERPIAFPPDVETNKSSKGRKVFLQMLDYRNNKGVSTEFVARSIWLTNKEEEEVGRPAGVYWNVKIKEQSPEHFAMINGHLGFTERPEGFKS